METKKQSNILLINETKLFYKFAVPNILSLVLLSSAGIVDGEVRLDLDYIEDSHAQVDSNVVLTKSGKIIEFQTTAEGEPYEQSQMLEIFNVAQGGIKKIVAMYDLV